MSASRLRRLLSLPAILLLAASCSPPPGDPAANVDFEVVDRSESRLRSNASLRRLRPKGTHAVLVVQHGRVVHEWYARGHSGTKQHWTASLAKTLFGGVGLALALDRGWLELDTRVAELYEPWAVDPDKSRITVGQLAAHCSGLEDAEEDGLSHGELGGWKGAFWKRDPEQDPFRVALERTPLVAAPGSEFVYSNPGHAVLAFTIAAAAARAGEPDLVEALRREVMEPLGIPDQAWSVGYGEHFDVDGVRAIPTWGGGSYTARAAARVGELYLEGAWRERAGISPQSLRRTTDPAEFPRVENDGGRRIAAAPGWFSNATRAFPHLPTDAIVGGGGGHQLLLVVPSMDLVAVRYGNALGDGSFWGTADEKFFKPLMAALRRPATEPSDVIGAVRFSPQIECRAMGSDNWPITWAADDTMVTSYGDGHGFEPKIEKKLSLGLAVIHGERSDFRGENLRSEDAERTGDGRKGPKASGMLALDGALYMWVRNTGNAQLVWSDDGGRSWTWGFRFERSFGSPAFVNYGRAYEGGPEDWVYTLSQDGSSAYEPADGLVLARAPRDGLREQQRWEFFAGFDRTGQPIWSASLREREPVLRNRDGSARVDVTYHPKLERYLMALGYDLEGGWGLFEAPQPWGPWKLAFHTPDWGLGDTHGYRIPSKWIDASENALGLLFSGRPFGELNYDAFCVREMRWDAPAAE